MSQKIRCLAVDDEPLALAKLQDYITRTPYLELAASCETAFEAIEAISKGGVDAIFLDINMPGLSGLELMETLKTDIPVVFTTAYAEYALDGYKYCAVDYLLKPFSFVDFQRAASRLLDRAGHAAAGVGTAGSADSVDDSAADADADVAAEPMAAADVLFVKVDYRYVGVRIDDILYIKGMSEYIQIFVEGRSPLVTLLSMREALAKLPANFLQIHRSYIVNMNHVDEITRQHLHLHNGESLAVGDNYRRAFLSYIRTHTLSRPRSGPRGPHSGI